MTPQKSVAPVSFLNADSGHVVVTFLATITVLFFFLSAFEYPPIIDVYSYIDTEIWDAFETYMVRFYWGNPRIGELPFIVAAGSSMARAFVCLSGIAFVITGAVMLIEGRLPKLQWADASIAFMVVALPIAFNPMPGSLYFYVAHNANYVLGFGILLCFLGLVRVGIKNNWHGPWPAVALPLVGFLAGMTNEHTTPAAVGLLAAGLAILAWFFRQKLRLWHFTAFVGLVFGLYTLITAPGQSSRYDGQGSGIFSTPLAELFGKLHGILDLYAYSDWVYIAPLLIVAASIVLHQTGGTREQWTKLLLSLSLFALSIGMAAALVFSPYRPGRLMYASNVSVALSITASIWALPASLTIVRMAAGIAAFIYTAIFLQFAYSDIRQYASQHEMREALVALHKSRGCYDVTLPAFPLQIGKTILSVSGSDDPDHWLNRGRANHWGLNSVRIEESDSPVTFFPCANS